MKRERVVSWDGTELSTLTAGESNRPAILFVPGWTMGAEVFAKQFDDLTDDFRIVSFDPRGQGESSKPSRGYTYQERAKDLRAIVEWIDQDDISIVSWSAGVLDHLALMDTLVPPLISAHVFVDGAPCTLIGKDNAWGWFTAEETAAKEFVIAPLADREAFNERFAKWMLEQQSVAAITWLKGISSQTPDWVATLTSAVSMFADYRSTLSGLSETSKVHFIVRDEWGSVAGTWQKQFAPNATFKSFGRHIMFWERAQQFNQLLRGMLFRNMCVK